MPRRRGQAPRRRKTLVIDASVAQAAGARADAGGSSRACRHFLQAVLEICHRVVLTSEIAREWRDHRSRFFRTWQLQMYARKKVDSVLEAEGVELDRQLERCGAEPKDLDAMQKDLHLIRAALASDRIVVSRDERVRRLFSALAATVPSLRRVVWVNPDRPEEEAVAWLEAGAGREARRKLGSAGP